MLKMIEKRVEVRKNDKLRTNFTKNFHKATLPGEKSIPIQSLRTTLHQQSFKQETVSLRNSIVESERTLKLASSGKRLTHVFSP
jgi:hypothetical protein